MGTYARKTTKMLVNDGPKAPTVIIENCRNNDNLLAENKRSAHVHVQWALSLARESHSETGTQKNT